MATDEIEIALHGGEINSVVRVGDTVRRTTGFWTPTIHSLLKHLAVVGFAAAPRLLGFDEKGREILSYIEGEVTSGNRPLPNYVREEETLIEVARLLRQLHEATAMFEVPENAQWSWPVNNAPGRRVICHSDFAPWNIAFQDRKPVGVIDWDLAAPGPVTADIATALMFFVPLSPGLPQNIQWRAKRVRLFCDAYGPLDRSHVFEGIRAKPDEWLAGVKHLSDLGIPGYRRMWESDDWQTELERDRVFLGENLNALCADL